MIMRLGNSKTQLLRWTVQRASREFRCDDHVLQDKLRAANLLPGKDGCYSTLQIYKAVAGDKEAEQTRKLKEEADEVAMRNERTRGLTADRADLYKRLEPIVLGARQSVENSTMSDTEKADIIQAWKNLLMEVEGKQA